MKLPEDIYRWLIRRFENKHREWLAAQHVENNTENKIWPLEIDLGIPTEQAALKQPDGVRAWITAWQTWQGIGKLIWSKRRWRSLGIQLLPNKLILQNPNEIALSIGEATRWERAQFRYIKMVERWPALKSSLPRYFDVLADYNEIDFERLCQMLAWIVVHPNSNLYPRQLPIDGLDSKWFEKRKGLLSDLVTTIRGHTDQENDFVSHCGLKILPSLIRLRILDQTLRDRIGGLGDITAPCEELATLDLAISRVFIVENLQTGLAFADIPNTLVLMGLGYHVEVLSRLPWIAGAQSIYWGDLDTHGFAILHRARTYLPNLQSILMDEETLLRHRTLWGNEKEQHSAERLICLMPGEQAVYASLKNQRWGQQIRLEQERIAWDYAWEKIKSI